MTRRENSGGYEQLAFFTPLAEMAQAGLRNRITLTIHSDGQMLARANGKSFTGLRDRPFPDP